jgi:geranylgeranyl diphosphate synthase type I
VIGAASSALSRARERLEPALRRAAEGLGPELGRVVCYHLGLTEVDGRPRDGAGGKAVRPTLAFLGAEAVGASGDVALPGALAVELVHNFSLLHDDVMDGDRMRRHRPAAWALFGVGSAITAGDALLAEAHRILVELPGPEGVRAARSLARATGRMILGQAQDLAFGSRLDVSFEECRRMAANKTGALLSCAASIGAILAGGPPEAARALEAFGEHLGVAFQAVDDLLGLWGRPERTGKPVASDLRQRKKTFPVVAALEARHPAADRLRALLAGELDEDAIGEALGLIEEAGGRARTEAEADQQLRRALAALDGAPLEVGARAELEELARFVGSREA